MCLGSVGRTRYCLRHRPRRPHESRAAPTQGHGLGSLGARGGQRGRRRRASGGARAGSREVHDVAGLLTSLGRVTGLLGALLALVELLLLARIPVLDASGLERVGALAPRQRDACASRCSSPTRVLITAGYALTDASRWHARDRATCSTGYSGRPPRDDRARPARRGRDHARSRRSAGGSPTGRGTPSTSPPTSASRSASATSSRPGTSSWASRSRAPTGGRSTPRRWRRSSASGSCCRWPARCATGCASSGCVPEAPGVVSLEIGGVRLDRLRVRSGQSLHWRFLAPRPLVGAHPFSLSAAPDGRRLRITVKELGDYSRRSRSLRAGHAGDRRGPVGRADQRGAAAAAGRADRRRVGHRADPRAAGGHCRASRGRSPSSTARASEDDVLFRDELDELARRRGAELHYVLGERRGDELLSAERLQALVPDIAGARRLRLRPAQHDRGHARQPARAGRAAAPHHQRGVRAGEPPAVVRRAVPAALATAAVVALLANVRARPPRSPRPTPRSLRCRRPTRAEAEVRRVSSRPPTAEGPRPQRDGDRDHAVLDHLGARDADRRRS